MDRKVSPALVDKILSANERSRCRTEADILRLWVLKEAYAKMCGRGWGSYLYETDFDPNDPRIQELSGCFVAVMEG